MKLTKADVAIMTPTPEEWEEMVKHLTAPETVDSAVLPMKCGRIGEYSVLCVMSGKGEEATASAFTLILERVRPRWALLVGIAGGFPEQKIHRGDVVVAQTVHSFDYGKLTNGVFVRRPEPDYSFDRSLLGYASLVAKSEQQQWRSHILCARPEDNSSDKSIAHTDCYVASSNKVVDDPDHEFYATVAAAFPEIHAVEMEAVGAGASARLAQSERQLGLLMIRGISDEPGHAPEGGTGQRAQWKRYAAAAAAAFTRELLESLSPTKTMTIIIPIYNESHAIRDLVKGLRAEGLADRYPIILCDDGSTDNSFEVMEQCCKDIHNITCLKNRFNLRKVGAIDRMTKIARTPFLLTLDADCMLSELRDGALETLMHKMSQEGLSATCFRIVPNARDWLGRLQKLDYSIFTDTLRRMLGVPVCLIGQGVLWRKDSLSKVLAKHSGQFHGDDLENTIIALSDNLDIYWEREALLLTTNPKTTIMGLVRQRALSWDFGMLRVLLGKRALKVGGESGAFYKNILLMDFIAHPFRLIAVPMLLSVALLRETGRGFYDSVMYELCRQSVAVSFKYGSFAIVSIWIASVVNSFVCVRGDVWSTLKSTLKWSIFNAFYLSSPFVYLMYYGLVRASNVNGYDVLGSSFYWLGQGLLLTYFWWVFMTLCLLWGSSLRKRTKTELTWSALLAPIYYFTLLVVCKTMGIAKYCKNMFLAPP